MKKIIQTYNIILMFVLILIAISTLTNYINDQETKKTVEENTEEVVKLIFNSPNILPKTNSFKLKEGKTDFLVELIDGEFFITELNDQLVLFFYKKNLKEDMWFCLGSPLELVPEYCKNPNDNQVPY